MTRTSSWTPTTMRPRYTTLPEAIEYCRSSRRSLERRIAEGQLERFQNGSRVHVDLNEADIMLRGERLWSAYTAARTLHEKSDNS